MRLPSACSVAAQLRTRGALPRPGRGRGGPRDATPGPFKNNASQFLRRFSTRCTRCNGAVSGGRDAAMKAVQRIEGGKVARVRLANAA